MMHIDRCIRRPSVRPRGFVVAVIAKPIVDMDSCMWLPSVRSRGFVVVFIAKPIVSLDGFSRFSYVRPCGFVVLFPISKTIVDIDRRIGLPYPRPGYLLLFRLLRPS